jgi:PTS system fructose-specific IIA component/PTS system nitrogen regulatory IIA component
VYSVAPVEAQTKEQVIRVVVGRLVEASHLNAKDRESIVSALMKRESLGSTGIGRGVAIPHISHPSVERVVGALATIPGGVEFDAVDAQPVYVLCLLVAPVDGGERLRALEAVARSLRDHA